MLETFTPRPTQGIMETILSELEVSVTCPLVPDPLNTTQEANIMLPDNRPHDYRISTTTTEDEFECDHCGNIGYRIINYETQGEIQTYAKCLECGWKSFTVTVAPPSQIVCQGFKPIPIPPRDCIYCKGAVDGCWQCNDTVAIASVGGVG